MIVILCLLDVISSYLILCVSVLDILLLHSAKCISCFSLHGAQGRKCALPMLLCMTGRVIDDTETTERVLWDLRVTVAEMMQENYFGYFTEGLDSNSLQKKNSVPNWRSLIVRCLSWLYLPCISFWTFLVKTQKF